MEHVVFLTYHEKTKINKLWKLEEKKFMYRKQFQKIIVENIGKVMPIQAMEEHKILKA